MATFDPPRVTVFCGSRHGMRPEYTEAAKALGACLVERGLGLVYGGGSVGLMGEIADAVLAAGGEVIGVIPEVLSRPEVAHQGLTELHVVNSMHERKRMMSDLCGGYIVMPGGIVASIASSRPSTSSVMLSVLVPGAFCTVSTTAGCPPSAPVPRLRAGPSRTGVGSRQVPRNLVSLGRRRSSSWQIVVDGTVTEQGEPT